VREDSRGDERELVARHQRGEPHAFEELVIVYQHRVYGVALRMLGRRADAEDVAQEAFLRAYRAVGEFRGDAKLSTWLYAITTRLCLNRLASPAHQRTRLDDELLSRVADDTGDVAAHVERREREAAVHAAIAELDDDRRVVLVLADLEGLAYEEIAEALGVPIGTVRSRLHRARMDLKTRLEKLL
jgi:RNA polymerase sigma-70 factor (ECF subfamily)